MYKNLSGTQVLLIIIAIIVIIWLVYWIFSKNYKSQEIIKIKEPIPSIPSKMPPSNMPPSKIPPTRIPSEPIITPPTKILNEPFALLYFYSPNCPHCQKFNKDWKEVYDKLKGVKGLNIDEIDGTKIENESTLAHYDISGFPTVLFISPDKKVEYEGDRSSKDLYNFVIMMISEYSK